MPLDAPALRAAIAQIAAVIEKDHSILTELDGKIGDGDLGLTLLKAFRALGDLKDALPADLGQAFLQMSTAVSKASSSSFGTLMATGLLAAAKATRGQQTVQWSQLPDLLSAARAAMQSRGRASLGDKTMLDALYAIEVAAADAKDPSTALAAARSAVDTALDRFRSLPNKIGRARVYEAQTIGMDDPGMVAMKLMLSALR